MRRLLACTALFLGLSLMAAPARADWNSFKCKWHAFWDRVHVDFHRNNAWPKPFNLADQQSVLSPIDQMVNAGWKMENTLTAELFDPETQQLNKAGQLKVRTILTQFPPQRRSIFVLRGASDQVTEVRLQSVESTVASLTRDGQPPEVFVSETIPRYGSGDYYDRINRGFQQTTPAPRLNSGGDDGGN